MGPAKRSIDPNLTGLFWTIAAAIAVARITTLIFSQANLGPDEAQYWFWSRDPDFGYFSKPPLIAWAIGATTFVFGNSEWAVRLSAPLFHIGAAGFLFTTARRLYGERIAFWTGLAWLTLPGVTLSSFVITTDAPLLFFWAAGLFLLFDILQRHDRTGPNLQNFILLGMAIGFGFLAKYAALYFLMGLGGAMVLAPKVRAVFLWRGVVVVVGVFALVAAPNVWWNFAHDFQTVGHTVENANWGASLFKPLALLDFWAGQFAVFGLLIVAAAIGIYLNRQTIGTKISENERILILFSAAPILIVSMQAFISRAHANWAAAAYPAATILVTQFLFAHRNQLLAKSTIWVHGGLSLLFLVGMLNFGLIDRVGLSGAVREIRGWARQSAEIVEKAPGFDAIMIDDRNLMGEMLYYERDSDVEIVAWDPNARISNHYEAFKAFDPARQSRLLFVTTRNDDAHVNYRFDTIRAEGSTTAALGDEQTRTFHLFDISDYVAPNAP